MGIAMGELLACCLYHVCTILERIRRNVWVRQVVVRWMHGYAVDGYHHSGMQLLRAASSVRLYQITINARCRRTSFALLCRECEVADCWVPA
jgi:hypothetical protein